MKQLYAYTVMVLSASGQKAPAPVNVLIIAWIVGIGGHIAGRDWLRDSAVLTGAVMVVVWLAGVGITDMFRRKSEKDAILQKDDGVVTETAGRGCGTPERKLSERQEHTGRLTVIGCEASVNG
ncbi:hypothetical protein RCT60_15305, partial [Escherichia coli]|nr:hypothetical protein [Escherichia coli]